MKNNINAPKEIMPLKEYESEFIVQEYYKVTTDISPIDIKPEDAELYSEHKDRMRRMFQAILLNKKALYSVLSFQAMAEHVANSDASWMIESHYGDENYEFADILTKFVSIFAQDDKEWWMNMVNAHGDFMKEHEKDKNYWDMPGYFELDPQIEDLRECFKVGSSTYAFQEHYFVEKSKSLIYHGGDICPTCNMKERSPDIYDNIKEFIKIKKEKDNKTCQWQITEIISMDQSELCPLYFVKTHERVGEELCNETTLIIKENPVTNELSLIPIVDILQEKEKRKT